MKRKIATALCTTLSVMFLLVGCGAGKEEQQMPSSNEETEATITPSEKPSEPESGEESELEDLEIQGEVPDEDANSEADVNPLLFEIENPVIYDAEGVTVTIDEWNLEGDSMKLTCSITNNNPDNKKVTFSASAVIDNYSDAGNLSFKNIVVGENDIQVAKGSLYGYFKFKENIGTESLPIESLSLYYKVQVGSDGETVLGHTVFKNPEITEDNFQKVYGDRIGEFEIDQNHDGIPDIPYEVYQKHIEKNNYTLITIKPANDSDNNDLFMDYWNAGVFINDIGDRPVRTVDGNETFFVRSETKMYCYLFDTPENIRKEFEISNDVPLEGNLVIYDMLTGAFDTISVKME